MFQTIVVGTDGSDPARAAVQRAGELARAEGGHVHLVSAYHPLSHAEIAEFRRQVPEEYWEVLDTVSGLSATVTSASRQLEDLAVGFDVHQIADGPVDALLQVADETGADLIVVGSRGLGTVKGALLGSVSTRVAHHAGVSVLIVHP